MGAIVKKHNAVIEASYNLTRLEQCCLLFCLTQIEVNDADLRDSYMISAKDFSEMFGIAKNRSYLELRNIAKLLFSRSVIINKEKSRLETRWVSAVEYVEGEGAIEITLSQKIKPYLLQLKREFTSYDIRNIAGFDSKYSIRIYEMIVQWQHSDRNQVDISIVELRDRLQLDGKYTQVNDLRVRVIEPAVEDINKHSNITVDFELKKKGRKFVSVLFSFREKETTNEIQPGNNAIKSKTKTKKPATIPRRFVEINGDLVPPGMGWDDVYAKPPTALRAAWEACEDWVTFVA